MKQKYTLILSLLIINTFSIVHCDTSFSTEQKNTPLTQDQKDLIKAIKEQNIDTATSILNKKTNPNFIYHVNEYENSTPLGFVCTDFTMDQDLKNRFILLLLSYKANIEMKDSKGKTPLTLAIERWDGGPTVKLLLEKDANPENVKATIGGYEFSALGCAYCSNNEEGANSLKQHGVPELTDKEQKEVKRVLDDQQNAADEIGNILQNARR